MADAPLKFTGSLAAVFPEGLAGLIFDCDGVMIDSACANRTLYNLILHALDLPSITPEQEKEAFQATFQQAIHFLVPEHLHDQLESVSRQAVDYNRDIVPKIKLMPGFREFVDTARQKGLKMAIDTNRTESGARVILEYFHLPQYFEPIMAATVVAPKPSPEGAVRICADWGVAPGQVLFVGDSRDDRLAAEGAQVVFAGFGGIEGTLSVNSWGDLALLLWGARSN